MQLGNFVWPHDPEVLRVRYRRVVEQNVAENGLWTTVNLGRFGRTFEGEGVFYGEDAYETLSELAMCLYNGVAQELIHPKWDKAKVLLTDLEVTEECENNFLRYSFKMVEVL